MKNIMPQPITTILQLIARSIGAQFMYLLAIFVYFVYCIYPEHRVFFRQSKDAINISLLFHQYFAIASKEGDRAMPTAKELELIRANENEQPALQKIEGVLN